MKKSSTGYHYKRSFLHHVAPVVVWLGAIACVAALFYQRSKRFEIVGISQGEIRQVAATCTGRLKSVPVQLFETVKAGQTVAVIDTILDNEQLLRAELKSKLAAASAEIEHLAARLVPTQDTLLAEETDREIRRSADMRRFLVDVENARLRILQLKALIASDRITVEDLAMEVKVVQALLEEDAVAPYELEKAKVRYDSLAKKIEENERLLEQAEVDLQQAETRCNEFAKQQPQHPSVDSALEVIRKEIGVQEVLVQGLLAQREAIRSREALELKAPIDGVVVPIPVRANEALMRRPGEEVVLKPGEVVRAGDPILAIAAVEASEVVAYIGDTRYGLAREKTAVELIKNSEPARIARSQVAYVGPTIELMPQRLWRNPNVPQWGRPLLIKVPPGMGLVPGELVGVRGL